MLAMVGFVGSACAPTLPAELTTYRIGPCDDFAIDAERVWNEKTQRALSEKLSAYPADFAGRTLRQAQAKFGEFTERWVRASKEACYETVIQRTLPRSSYVALSACFDAALIQERVVIERLVEADPETVGNAYDAMYEVERALDACERPMLYQDYALDVEAKDAAALGRSKGNLAQARAFLAIGKTAPAFDAASRADTDAGLAGVPRVRARSLLEQGRALEAMARYREAGARAEIALDMFYEQQSPAGASEALELLARVDLGVGRYELALRRQAEALAIRRSILGPAHVEVGLALTGLAQAKQMAGHHEEALEELRAAEQVYAETLEPGHPFLLRAVSGMSSAWAALGEFDHALEAERGALAAAEARLGADHPEVSRIRHEIAETLLAAGRPQEGLTEAAQALAMREKAFGPMHPVVAVTLQLVADLERRLLDYAAARTHLERALELRKKAFGDQHRLVGESYEQLGLVASETGDAEQALSEYQQALAILKAALGPSHPRVLGLEQRVGETLLALGRYPEAQQLFERVREDLDKRFGPTHPSVAAATASLGKAEEAQGRLDQARTYYERVLALREATLPDKDADLGFAAADLARVLAEQRNYKAALPLAERALGIFESALAPEALPHADALVTLGIAELGLYRRGKGIDALRAALVSYRRALTAPAAGAAPGAASKSALEAKVAGVEARLKQLGVTE